MGKEVLAIPEENLDEVIEIIRTGLLHCKGISRGTRSALFDWCKRMSEEDDGS